MRNLLIFCTSVFPYVCCFIVLSLVTACELLSFDDSNKTNAVDSGYKPIPHSYPQTYNDSTVVDDYFGYAVNDPYRWLENDTASAVKNWATQQQALTTSYLDQIPFRKNIRNRLTALWNFERTGVPEYHAGYYYFLYNNGRQNQDVLCRIKNLKDSLEVVLDPNLWSENGTYSLESYAFSKSGQYLAYQFASAGSDVRKIKVLDLVTSQHLPDLVEGVTFSEIAWSGNGFYYSSYPKDRNRGSSLYGRTFHQLSYHQLEKDQSEDELIYADRRYPYQHISAVTDSLERWLILYVSKSTSTSEVYFIDNQDKDAYFTPINESVNNEFSFVGSKGNDLFFLTNEGAANGRLVKINTQYPEQRYWEEIIAERSDALQSVELLGDRLLATYLRDASSHVVVFDLNGQQLRQIRLPELGTVTAFAQGKTATEVFFGFTSFTRPETVYRLRLDDYSTVLFRQPTATFRSVDYETSQIWVDSYDGTAIPAFVIRKKNLAMDVPHPTFLYGDGGFNVPVTPRWNLTRLLLIPAILEQNGICVVANLRGGGEFGSKWHQAGTMRRKQQVFDDFQAVAEYLDAQPYSETSQLGIYGRSNGGLLVGACLSQRPDLFQVAIPAVGVLDMMRYHRFTIGWSWATEYGTSADSSRSDYLLSYSPLHNLSGEKYPATLITTADRDEYVVPAHSFKFAAELQHQQQGDMPILLRIDRNAGHGGSTPVVKRIEEGADVVSFFFYHVQPRD